MHCENKILYSWRESWPREVAAAGVCLHGHTMHSQECLSFLRRYLRRISGLSRLTGWSDRIFYRCDDGAARSLSQIWQGREPRLLSAAVAAVQFFAAAELRPALRILLSAREGAQL